MGDIKTYSPFFKIRRTLNLLRWVLGFPLKPMDDSFTNFEFKPRLEIFKFFAVISFPIILHVYLVIIFVTTDGNLENYIAFMKGVYYHYSRSKIDHLVVLTWTAIIFVVLNVNFYVFKNNTKVINEFGSQFCYVKATLISLLKNISQYKDLKSNKKIFASEYLLIFGQILNIIATCLFSVWLYKTTEIIGNGKTFPILQGIRCFAFLLFYALQVSSTLFGPMSSTVELIICQCINEMAYLFEDWKRLLEATTLVPANHVEDHTLKVNEKPKRRKR